MTENPTPLPEQEPENAQIATPAAAPPRRWRVWILQGITYSLLAIVVSLLAITAYRRLSPPPVSATPFAQAFTGTPAAAENVPISGKVRMAPLNTSTTFLDEGIVRATNLRTVVPPRPRVDVITYTVQKGDSLFSIADQFGIKPETLLWGNFEVLKDNPHLVKAGQVLNILPVNGTYYQWHQGDTLDQIAKFFKTDKEKILTYPGNRFDLTQGDNPSIAVGQWLIIPDGKRELKDWGPPAISRNNPASARYYGEGHCGSVYTGAVGNGTFVWPTVAHSISGYSYVPGVHPAIDIAGAEGAPVYATDSGVVVYSGWSNYGYGYLLVIDHGNGWQSAYAHLSAIGVGCGQSVFQGGSIGAVGNTGYSFGSHLHFELVYGGAKLNPLDFLP